jgi:hypothetical protein
MIQFFYNVQSHHVKNFPADSEGKAAPCRDDATTRPKLEFRLTMGYSSEPKSQKKGARMKISCRVFLAVSMMLLATLPSAGAESDIKLPNPVFVGKLSFEAAVVRKQSVRDLSRAPLTMTQVSQILWAANGNLPADPPRKSLHPREDCTHLRSFSYAVKRRWEKFPLACTGTILREILSNLLQQVTTVIFWPMLLIASSFWRKRPRWS